MDDLSPQALDAIPEIAGWLERTAINDIRSKTIKDGVLVAATLLRKRTAALRPGDTREIYLMALPNVLTWATQVYVESERTNSRGEIVSWTEIISERAQRKRVDLNHEAMVKAMHTLAGDRRYRHKESPLDIDDVQSIVDVVESADRSQVNSTLECVTRVGAEAVVQLAVYGHIPEKPTI